MVDAQKCRLSNRCCRGVGQRPTVNTFRSAPIADRQFLSPVNTRKCRRSTKFFIKVLADFQISRQNISVDKCGSRSTVDRLSAFVGRLSTCYRRPTTDFGRPSTTVLLSTDGRSTISSIVDDLISSTIEEMVVND